MQQFRGENARLNSARRFSLLISRSRNAPPPSKSCVYIYIYPIRYQNFFFIYFFSSTYRWRISLASFKTTCCEDQLSWRANLDSTNHLPFVRNSISTHCVCVCVRAPRSSTLFYIQTIIRLPANYKRAFHRVMQHDPSAIFQTRIIVDCHIPLLLIW